MQKEKKKDELTGNLTRTKKLPQTKAQAQLRPRQNPPPGTIPYTYSFTRANISTLQPRQHQHKQHHLPATSLTRLALFVEALSVFHRIKLRVLEEAHEVRVLHRHEPSLVCPGWHQLLLLSTISFLWASVRAGCCWWPLLPMGLLAPGRKLALRTLQV